MAKIAFVSDGNACIPAGLRQALNIIDVPNLIIFGEKEYQAEVEISMQEVCDRMRAGEFPTTAAAAPHAYLTRFEQLLSDGYDVISLIQSSKISRTYQSALQAKNELGADNLVLIDSFQQGMGYGWPMIRAARMAQAGKSFEACVAAIQEGLKQIIFLGTIDTLEPLVRSGRISHLQHTLGSILNLKPIFSMQDGAISAAGRVRSRKKSLRKIAELFVAQLNGRKPVHLSVLHADAEADARTILDLCLEQVDVQEHMLLESSPILAAGLGPGALGLNALVGVS